MRPLVDVGCPTRGSERTNASTTGFIRLSRAFDDTVRAAETKNLILKPSEMLYVQPCK